MNKLLVLLFLVCGVAQADDGWVQIKTTMTPVGTPIVTYFGDARRDDNVITYTIKAVTPGDGTVETQWQKYKYTCGSTVTTMVAAGGTSEASNGKVLDSKTFGRQELIMLAASQGKGEDALTAPIKGEDLRLIGRLLAKACVK